MEAFGAVLVFLLRRIFVEFEDMRCLHSSKKKKNKKKITKEGRGYTLNGMRSKTSGNYLDSMYVLLGMPFKVNPLPSFIVFFGRV